MIHCTGYLIFGLGIILGKDLGIENIYLSGLLLTVPKFFSHVVMGTLINRFRIKTLNIALNSIVGALVAILLIMDLIHNSRVPYAERSQAFRIIESGRAHQCWAF